ncbi:MAG: peptidoglycan recognition family protein [Candidatus Saccharimonadales bacterium]
MGHYINENKFRQSLAKQDWYLGIVPELKKLERQAEASSKDERNNIKEEVYSFFEKALANGEVLIGEEGYNFDQDRRGIDTIVIHHTSEPSGISLNRLNAMHLIRLYATSYANPVSEAEKEIKGQPIYSGHFYDGRQVFWTYHWLIRKDGSKERLLRDEYVGWHAGDWGANCRSVAICFDGDFSNSTPNKDMIKTAKEVIQTNYRQVNAIRILGHREVYPQTVCPGSEFVGGWQKEIQKND